MLAAASVALLALLATPVDIDLRLQSQQRPKVRVRARFLGGLLPPVLMTGPRKQKKRPAKKKTGQLRKSWSNTSAFPSAIGRLIKELLRAVQIRNLSINAEFGLGDPAETGALFGSLVPLAYGTSGCSQIDLSLTPDFDHARLSGTFDATLRFVPVALLPPVARFGWKLFGPAR